MPQIIDHHGVEGITEEGCEALFMKLMEEGELRQITANVAKEAVTDNPQNPAYNEQQVVTYVQREENGLLKAGTAEKSFTVSKNWFPLLKRLMEWKYFSEEHPEMTAYRTCVAIATKIEAMQGK